MTWQPEKSGTPILPIRAGWSLLAALVVTCATFALITSPQAVAAPSTDDYIVLLRAGADAPDVARAERRRGNEVEEVFDSRVNGLVANLGPADVKRLRQDPDVAVVERDGVVRALGIRDSETSLWGLDRIDQRSRSGNGRITTATDGSGVKAYIIDTGIRADHQQFENRVALDGFTAFSDGQGWNDCHGHGTHVGGTVAGKDYGVAPRASLVAVRVLDCNGSGSTSGVIAGIDWVASDHPAGVPAVANLSLGGGYSSSMNLAIQRVFNDGVSVAVAAGNSNANACNYSPASAPEAITVGATTSTDARASFSNFGSCLDIFAPGAGILSATHLSTTSTATWNGTSMASPHVAGAAALLLSGEPELTPAQVTSRLSTASTTGVVTDAGSGSLNRLLFVGDSSTPNPTPEPPPPPPPAAPGNDNFSAAATLSGLGGVTGTTVGATVESGESTHGPGSAHSIWYRWTAPASGTLTLNTQGSDYDTLLAAYTGSAVNATTQRAANDDSGSGVLWSRISFPVTAGTVYSIAIDGYAGTTGSTVLAGTFTESSTPPPPPAPTPPANDNFANAVALNALTGTNGTTVGATRETGEPSHGPGSARSIWYRWTAPAGGTLTLNTQGSSYDTLLAVYTGSAVSSLTQRAVNDDSGSGARWSRVTFPVTAGMTYSVAIDGYNGSSGSTVLGGAFTPTPAPQPPALSGPDEDGFLTFSGAEAGETYLCRIAVDVDKALRECESPYRLPVTLTDGTYPYRLVIEDENGVRSTETTGTFAVSGTPAPPEGQAGVSINRGEVFTADPNVTLNVVWPAGTQSVLVANDGSLDGEVIPVAGEIEWTLASSGSERLPKTVYLRFLGRGGIALGTVTDDIVLDQQAPTVDAARLLSDSGRSVHRVRLDASDRGSGLDRVEISSRKKRPRVTVSRSEFRQLSGSALTVRSAKRPRWYRVSDRAGNWSVWAPIRPAR